MSESEGLLWAASVTRFARLVVFVVERVLRSYVYISFNVCINLTLVLAWGRLTKEL